MRLYGAIIAIFALTGCAKSNTFDDPTTGDGGTTKPAEMEPPHAEGNVFLGEAHSTKGGTATPIVSVSFIPDSTAVKACGATTIGQCKMTKAPKCTTACGTGEYCTWDDACNAVCKKTCTMSCATDEECYFPSEGAAAECRKKESFDSGAVAFAGTTVPITLYPPYKYSGPTTGAPFLAGADITVQGSGAAGAGFTQWQQSVKATQFLQTKLESLTPAVIFGTGALPVDWIAGSDKITITLAGQGGAVTCDANDSAGHYDVAREAVDAALGTSSTLSVSVSRQKQDIKKGISTKGMLTASKIQSEGWVKISTYSTESTSFQGCTNGLAMCGGKCTSVLTDANNCGKCGNVCSGGSCTNGTCSTGGTSCQTCETNAKTGSCKTQYTACSTNSACVNLSSCIANCGDQTCVNNCASTYSSGVTAYNNWVGCICNTACFTECKMECGN